jgi:hypothetical protein
MRRHGRASRSLDDYSEQADAWTPPDWHVRGRPARRVFNVGTSVRDAIPSRFPRATFRAVMARLFELDAALQAGELEPRIDASMPVPPPVPEPPEPTERWRERDWWALEFKAQDLDEHDPADGRVDRSGALAAQVPGATGGRCSTT